LDIPKSTGLVTINGLAINYTITGHGRPVVLVHGHASSQELWAKVNLLNSGKYCRYTLDLPGHGAADKPPLEWFTLENYTALLDLFCRHFGLKDILLVGHSMGGLLSLNLALTRPELVASMILIAPVVEGSFLAYLDPWLGLEKFVHHPLTERLLQIYNAYPWLAAPVALVLFILLVHAIRAPQEMFAPAAAQPVRGSILAMGALLVGDFAAPLLGTAVVVLSAGIGSAWLARR